MAFASGLIESVTCKITICIKYLFIHQRIHVVNRLGSVVSHDGVEELGDDLRPLLVVGADQLGPLGLVEHLLDDQPGIVLRPQDVQEQAVMVDSLSELVAI